MPPHSLLDDASTYFLPAVALWRLLSFLCAASVLLPPRTAKTCGLRMIEPLAIVCCVHLPLVWKWWLTSAYLAIFPQQRDLHRACRHGYIKAAQLILYESIANVNTVDKRGKAPLEYAVENQFYEVAELLLSKGASCSRLSQSGLYSLLQFVADKALQDRDGAAISACIAAPDGKNGRPALG